MRRGDWIWARLDRARDYERVQVLAVFNKRVRTGRRIDWQRHVKVRTETGRETVVHIHYVLARAEPYSQKAAVLKLRRAG